MLSLVEKRGARPSRSGNCVAARAGEVLAGAPLDNGDVDARQRQLARQHQPCRTSSADHHRSMLGHSHTSHCVASGFGRQLCGTTRGLPQAPLYGIK
jgi:hypothetical protein